MSNREDKSLLEDILEALNRIEMFTASMDYKDFLDDFKTQDAVVRNLEILGEATKLISQPLTQQYPNVPWSHAARLRDRLIHHYFGVNLDIVWDILTNDLPPLKKQIQDILGSIS